MENNYMNVNHISIDNTEQELKKIPADFHYEKNWVLSHNCTHCETRIDIITDNEKPEKNYQFATNLNSKNTNIDTLKSICTIFDNFVLEEIEGVKYINRKDFNYTHDFQRKSSVKLVNYRCCKCESHYLAHILIGRPQEADKYNNTGTLGKITVNQIINIGVNNPILVETQNNKQHTTTPKKQS